LEPAVTEKKIFDTAIAVAAKIADERAKKSTVPEAKVPWDAALLGGRNCQSCAAYFEASHPDHPDQYQGFCRRGPATLTKMRVMEVRRDLKGNPVMKDGQPVMQPAESIGFLYPVTQREGTCFDGWRALGTLPGETAHQTMLRQIGQVFDLSKMPEELREPLRVLLGVAHQVQ
jgi:hypothetical protein